ncbi:type III polyketide synthase [Paenibacillus turpanensis]|uniref:type III polyketide synthase n=1 Tax=Paenibacillus turpanensis TaxID=2689078 RepID=UPI001FB5F43E|nr:3-oxoacyl-[acyl-carrier-protein] synthase III C-terminal domain-containing protein [Paenibacillus turpanensis]
MPYVSEAASAVPSHPIAQSDVKELVLRMFRPHYPGIEKLISVFDHSEIEQRYFCAPLDWYPEPHSPEQKHRMYVEHACQLAEEAARRCLQKASLEPEHIDHLIFVSTTGTATPSIDAHLFNRLSFKRNLKRTPIWGLGCAGGAAGLSRALEYVKAFPTHRCLVVAVELCSLTFLPNDRSKSNIVATCLFGDGAAAVLVCGDETEPKRSSPLRLELLGSQSTTWKDSLDIMGWDIVDEGMKVVFSRDIPSLVRKEIHPNVEELVHSFGVEGSQIRNYVLHPGGMKVLQAYREALQAPDGALDASADILREYGNMSSCTVFFVMERMLSEGRFQEGHGILGALGPGFSSELVLFHAAKSPGVDQYQ